MVNYRTLGCTGLRVSEIAIGAFPISGRWQNSDGSFTEWSGADDRESINLIHRAQDLGVNLIDTAESYGLGHSEELIGRALDSGRREKWVIATKVSPNAGLEGDKPEPQKAQRRIFEACEKSLQRLQTDRIDIYQLHAHPFDWSYDPVQQALSALQKQGKIRWYGISTNSQEAVLRLSEFGPVHLMQIGYNLLQRQAEPLLRWCSEKKLGTLIRVPLAKGLLTGKYFDGVKDLPKSDVRYARFTSPEAIDALNKLPQLKFLSGQRRTMTQAALRFVLDNPNVHTVLCGAKTCEQVEENAAASKVSPLSEKERERAFSITSTITPPPGIT